MMCVRLITTVDVLSQQFVTSEEKLRYVSKTETFPRTPEKTYNITKRHSRTKHKTQKQNIVSKKRHQDGGMSLNDR